MAQLSKGKKYSWEIQFEDLHGAIQTISLAKSKYNEKTAFRVKDVVEELLRMQFNGEEGFAKETWVSKWIAETASPELREKLSKVGLIKLPERHTCKELWDAFLQAKKKDVEEEALKESTLQTYLHTERRFFAFFDERTMISELTKEQMLRWKEFLRKEVPRKHSGIRGLKTSTIAGAMTKAKAVFNWAVDSKWLKKSPLNGVERGSFRNKKNDRFIRLEDYVRLLNACPCYDWVTIIALARIGGLRAPSEVLRLKWSDINWDEGYLTVTSVKTERYGKGTRQVPLFPELREILDSHPNRNNSDSVFVISRYRDPEQTNLGTQFARIAKAAGLDKIPRPFDNMRASRSTELFSQYGPIAEAEWLGHSPKTAIEAYLQIRPEDIQRATTERMGTGKQLPPEAPKDAAPQKDDENDEDSVVL